MSSAVEGPAGAGGGAALRRQGQALFHSGRLPQAEDCLRRALREAPADAALHNNLGVVLAARGRHAEALTSFEEALRLRPAYPQAHHNRGNALRDLGRPAEAVPSYEEALRLDPRDAATCFDLGITLLALDRRAAALPHLRQAARLRPDHADAHDRLGQALAAEGRPAEAAEAYRRAAELRPTRPESHHNLGVVLARLGRHAEAAAAYREAVRLRPTSAEAHNNLGFALGQVGQPAEAAPCFREALRLDPAYAEAHNNLAITLVKLGEVDAALASFAEALRLRPDYPKARTNRAMALIQSGDYAQGWREYEWRWRTDDFTLRDLGRPRWDGGPLEGRTVLLHTEQGLGDTLQFIRYAPLVRQRGGPVVLEAPARLLPLLSTCPGIDRQVARGAPLPEFEVEAPLLSLPALFGTTPETVPALVPYLFADPALALRWAGELAAVGGLKVGIAWQGSPGYRDDRHRSIPLRHFAPLACLPGVRLVSLQKGPGAEQLAAAPSGWGVLDLGRRLDEGEGAFLDTAAVVTGLDLVVSADTAVGHLAGALGVPVWLALPFAADFRWGLGREDTPWYPTMRLFRQRCAGDWDEVFARMAEVLGRRAAGHGAGGRVAVDVSPGELIDRITILELKSERMTDPAKLAAVRAELASLHRVLASVPGHEEVAGLAAALKAVNGVLWQVEDDLRRCEAAGDFGAEFVALARSVYRNNDERAALKRRINERLGAPPGEQKAYTPYQ